jgi:2-aminobenzoate-CoA ligase
MKDIYPRYAAVPTDSLVPPDLQPEYLGEDVRAERGVAEAILDPDGGGRPHQATAIIHHESGLAVSYADLERQSARLASGLLRLGIQPGDRVAVRSANRPHGIIAALAAWRSGGVVVPIPTQAPAQELAYFLTDTGARVLITEGDPASLAVVDRGIRDTQVEQVVVFAEEVADHGHTSWAGLAVESEPGMELPRIHPDALAIIWHTGGTTGKPKACYHTHRRFLLAGYSLGSALGVQAGQRWAAAAPIGHALGFIYHTIYTLLHGATIVMIESYQRPELLVQAIADHDVDTFAAIAATWSQMKAVMVARPELPVPRSTLRAFAMWQSSSASEVYDWWKGKGIELANNFGSTSFANWVLVPRQGSHPPRGSLGCPAPGYEIVAIDPEGESVIPLGIGQPGRMAVRGPTGLTYWNRLDLQRRDVRNGWTLVDDMIEIGQDGNVTYLGRTDFLISTAGYKVAPAEVETALASHPAVREVAVLGVPDPVRREVVAAFVAVNDGVVADDGLRRELQDMVKRELAPYKYPRVVEFVDKLPRDAVGKVVHRTLRDAAVTSVLPGQETPAP